MKKFQRISLLLVLALALKAHAQPADFVKISGSVVDKQGHPVADASVDCYLFPNQGLAMAMPDVESKQHTTTGSTGAFSFSVPGGAAAVIASKSGFAPAWKTFSSTPDHPLEPLVLAKPPANYSPRELPMMAAFASRISHPAVRPTSR